MLQISLHRWETTNIIHLRSFLGSSETKRICQTKRVITTSEKILLRRMIDWEWMQLLLLSSLFAMQDRRWAYDNQLVWRMGIWQWDSFKVGRQIKEETNKQYVMQISFQTVMWWERMVSLIGARKQIDLIALQHNTYWILNMPTSIWLALKQDITRRKDKPSNNTLHRN
jgi:hypothetical protein